MSALRQVQRHTDDYVIIDRGPLGTRCARLGCMPSKVLISAAKDFHRRHVLEREGIRGAERLAADIPAVMRHVRLMRDHFAGSMVEVIEGLAGDRLIRAKAEITARGRIRAADREIEARTIIIATGSRPVVPGGWERFGDRILTSDTIFEQEDLPHRIAVIGLGPVGLELGQALSRLGIEITAFSMKDKIAAITDPQVNAAAVEAFSGEFAVHTGAAVQVQESGDGLLVVHPRMEVAVDAALVAVGSSPELAGLGLENFDVQLNEAGLPQFDVHTGRVEGLDVFIAGDANGCCAILHEALDEGFIAGRNASTADIKGFCRRTRLHIVFSDPQIAIVGMDRGQLHDNGDKFVVGRADFAGQSRAVLELHAGGLMHIYARAESGRLLGAELVCPDAEHLGHQLALAMQNNMTVFDMLQMPFYHPTTEEALRTALRDAARQLPAKVAPAELSLCDSAPEPPLS